MAGVEERVGSSTTADKQYFYLSHYYLSHYVDAIAMQMTPSGTHYYLQDANFNVTAVVDDTGAVKERYSYTPYGEVTILDLNFSAVSGNVSTISNEHLYTGRRRDPETGLQLNRNRFYASHLGRWVNRDPIGYSDSLNLYEYARGRVITFFDPFGLLTCKEKQYKNERGRVKCSNDCFNKDSMKNYRACRASGGGVEDCTEEAKDLLDNCDDDCDKKFPDVDCGEDDYACFQPEKCLLEAAKVALTAASCTNCLIGGGFPGKGFCPACLDFPAVEQKYIDCL